MNREHPLLNAFNQVQLIMDDSNNRFFQQFGLGVTRYYALLYVRDEPGVSLSELSHRLLCTKGNTTRVIRVLETNALIQREADPGDSRAQRLSLTPAGAALLKQVEAAYREFNARRFSCFSIEEQSQLLRALERLKAPFSPGV